MNHLIHIHGMEIPVVEVHGVRVVTLAMVDRVHQRPNDTAGRNFRENRARFIEGDDYLELTADEIRRQSLGHVFPPRTAKGIVLTESGYLMLVKSFTDDLAWKVQRDLVNGYFRQKANSVASMPEVASKLVGELAIMECFTRLLRPAPSSQVAMLQYIGKRHALDTSFLPAYVVDAAEDGPAGSSMPTASLTALLKEHGITTNVATYNVLLRDAGMLEERTRKSTSAPNGKKHFWAITEKGLTYGKNLTNPASPRETQPHWYVDRFAELHAVVSGRLLGKGGVA
ncbi:ORF6N domain-containing protein [Achromobacter marplatensis]|uniref:ORF6N domain-containing protein n=1 Tax=Achromobacter marplatensis TaxID=470868 RepID=A0AA42WE38_9BURK|nr:ORF6N domain-containing protein [Achromobacter marplatensis]MDH2052556.1 ORF6N domain-containing protein [Achromobacter marplatensis]